MEEKWSQEFIDSIKDPDLKKALAGENLEEKSLQEAVDSISEEQAAAFDEFRMFCYYKPPFDWEYWIENFSPEVRQLGYQVMHRRAVEDWTNMALSVGNVLYAGELMEPYDNGELKAKALQLEARTKSEIESKLNGKGSAN